MVAHRTSASSTFPRGDPPPFAGPVSLENGDRLTRCEFERRYLARPDLNKVELIEGVVYMPSPVRADSHAKPNGAILGWVSLYSASTPGVSMLPDATVRLDGTTSHSPTHCCVSMPMRAASLA